MTLLSRDQKHIWHPFTQHKQAMLPSFITRGKGAYLYDEHGKRYLDLISSWWVNLHGHSHPDIAEAIYQQAMTLEHVIFAGFTHEPAVLLAEQLLTLLPKNMSKVFYSDNGSTAVEVALKMAYQYWRNRGEPKRKRFIAFRQSYHGDTFGSMSVGKQSGFFSHFDDLLFDVTMFDYPATWLQDETVQQREQHILNQMSVFLNQFGEETAALIIEPLVQGVAGMQMCRPVFLQALEQLMRAHGVLIIYDEVMTGFGRTGEIFACRKSSTTPDIICLAKGLTGGFLPLAVTVCHDNIYQAFLGDNFKNALAHGHSFTANPLGCRAALASLTLLQQPDTLARIAMIEQVHQNTLANWAGRDIAIEKLRYCGTIAAFDLQLSTEYSSYDSLQLREKMTEQGLLIRPLGNVLYFLPPYCITEPELKNAYEVIAHTLQGVTT